MFWRKIRLKLMLTKMKNKKKEFFYHQNELESYPYTPTVVLSRLNEMSKINFIYFPYRSLL